MIMSGVDITPTRKRKRNIDTLEEAAVVASGCFANAAFAINSASTPKCLLGRPTQCKETSITYLHNDCLEEKSIADLLQQPQLTNPFEVMRKPPKKRKRPSSDDSCFENAALNLEVPEKLFNPFEVQREVIKESPKCFVNAALNLRNTEPEPTPCNPYEITRTSPNARAAGVENPCLATSDGLPQPTQLQLALPFTPRVGCRIDFKNMPIEALTPSRLLAEKLVFSPVAQTAKRSLSAISEELSMDIGQELDCYQLELENSINEAKLRKNIEINVKTQETILSPPSSKLDGIIEETEHAEVEKENEITAAGNVTYASDSDADDDTGEIDFKAPARFVRAYRPAAAAVTATAKRCDSKESLKSTHSQESNKSTGNKKTITNMGSFLRKSVRKLLHNNNNNKTHGVVELTEGTAAEKTNNFLTNIRQSLRRSKRHVKEINEEQHDVSIVDVDERKLKLKSADLQTEYMQLEQLTNEKKRTVRNSIRRKLKTVLQQPQQEYACTK